MCYVLLYTTYTTLYIILYMSYTIQDIPYTIYFIPHAIYYKLCSIAPSVNASLIVPCTVNSVRRTIYDMLHTSGIHYALCNPQCILYSVYYILWTACYILYVSIQYNTYIYIPLCLYT